MENKSVGGKGASGKSVKLILIAAAALVSAGVLAAVVINSSYVTVGKGSGDSLRLSKNTEQLDLSGTGFDDYTILKECESLKQLNVRGCDGFTSSQYDELKAANPECEILWDVPINGTGYPSDTESIKLSALDGDAIAMLGYLPELTEIDATECEYSDALLEARDMLGDDVKWTLTYRGKSVDASTTELSVSKAKLTDDSDLRFILDFFPSIIKLEADDCGLSDKQLMELRGDYPKLSVVWHFDFYGQNVCSTDKEIDISETRVKDTDEFRSSFERFEKLDKIIMCDCGVSNEEMDKLCNEYPDTRFVWRVTIGEWSVRTDAKYFCTNILYGNEYVLKSYDIIPLKYCVDLEHIDIGHSEVDDLSPLAGLVNLKTLIVATGGCLVSDLTPLKDLVHMQYLELFMNQISDLSPLANMHELLDLNLTFNNVTDITPLLGLTQLERCWIAQNPISDEDKALLEETLPMCEFNFTVYASTDGGWRLHERYFEMREYFHRYTDEKRILAHCERPYEVQPENYLTHYNAKYKALEEEEQKKAEEEAAAAENAGSDKDE